MLIWKLNECLVNSIGLRIIHQPQSFSNFKFNRFVLSCNTQAQGLRLPKSQDYFFFFVRLTDDAWIVFIFLFIRHSYSFNSLRMLTAYHWIDRGKFLSVFKIYLRNLNAIELMCLVCLIGFTLRRKYWIYSGN